VTNSGFRVGDPAPEALPRRSESDVVARWEGVESAPVVSVVCPTYQHVDFIEDALRGFLGQDTEFPFEIVVRDDASTDGTAEIVRDYAERYPTIVRAVLEPVNRRQRRAETAPLRELARGEFLARCDGDDYWLDPRKLQRQVEELRERPDAVLAHHDAIVIEDGRITATGRLSDRSGRDLTGDELSRGALTLTLSMLHRNVGLRRHPRASEFMNGDEFLRAQLGTFGGAVFIPDLIPAVYRRHAGGMWSTLDGHRRAITHAQTFFWIAWWFAEAGRDDLAAWWLGRSQDRIRFALEASHGVLPEPDGALRRRMRAGRTSARRWLRSSRDR
jgi:glycosyltransferase involved in cell wall biosynthesis